MRIRDLLSKESIQLNVAPASKNDIISQLVDLMDKSGKVANKEQYLKDVLAREASGTTGLGDGIATPHAKSTGVKEAGLAAITVPAGTDFDSMDGLPSRLFFLIAAPANSNDAHLELLSKLATMLMDPDFANALVDAKTVDEFFALIDAKEKGETINTTAPAAPEVDSTHKILAVTACPTGIAHTFMAAESLEQHAKKRGIWIKVETNGSGGAKNVLTKQEIQEADCIIIAADKNVEMARFDGKPVIKTKVANGINKADELLDKALSGQAPIYHHAGGTAASTAYEIHRSSDLQASDERCISYAAIRYRRWYSYRLGLPL